MGTHFSKKNKENKEESTNIIEENSKDNLKIELYPKKKT